jgi:hypothetical protein
LDKLITLDMLTDPKNKWLIKDYSIIIK